MWANLSNRGMALEAASDRPAPQEVPLQILGGGGYGLCSLSCCQNGTTVWPSHGGVASLAGGWLGYALGALGRQRFRVPCQTTLPRQAAAYHATPRPQKPVCVQQVHG